MPSALIQIVLLVAVAVYFGWLTLRALRSGRVSFHVRYNRDRDFSRRANPAGYWTVVCWYLALAAVAALGAVIRFSWQ
jgi:hypothetical protein